MSCSIKCKPCLSPGATDSLLLLLLQYDLHITTHAFRFDLLGRLHTPSDSMCQPEQPSAEARIITVQYAELLESNDLTAIIAEVTPKLS